MTISDFKKDTSLTSIPENSSNLTNLDLEPVIAYGRLRALFGEPNYETQNFEDAYSYILFVESESSEKIYLEVYEGSSGPAIGGLNNAESLQAAETLKKLIEESEEVADYDMVEYGIGTCFFSDSGIHTNKILRKGRFAIWNTENLTIR